MVLNVTLYFSRNNFSVNQILHNKKTAGKTVFINRALVDKSACKISELKKLNKFIG